MMRLVDVTDTPSFQSQSSKRLAETWELNCFIFLTSRLFVPLLIVTVVGRLFDGKQRDRQHRLLPKRVIQR